MAINTLELMLQSAQGVKKDKLQALEWFKKSAELGNKAAHYLLGVAFFDGKVFLENATLTREWFQ